MPAYGTRDSTRESYKEETLVASQTITTTGTGSAVTGFGKSNKLRLFAKVGTVTGTSPNLVFNVQDTLDGTNWNTLASFTAITATNGVQWLNITTPFTDTLRITWTVTGTNPNFATATVSCASWA